VDSDLGRWKPEDKPACTSIDRSKVQHVVKESAVGLGIATIQE
jgi:hypothetical protein